MEFSWNIHGINPEMRVIEPGNIDAYTVKDQMIASYGHFVLLDLAQELVKHDLAPDNGEPIFTTPHTHNDGREIEQFSDGVYISRYTKKKTMPDGSARLDEVMISFFHTPVERPNGFVPETPISSKHKHEVVEKYKKFGEKGKVFLRINDTNRIALDDEYIVEPGNWHQVEVEKGPVILIIHMVGAGGQTDDVLHNFGHKTLTESAETAIP